MKLSGPTMGVYGKKHLAAVKVLEVAEEMGLAQGEQVIVNVRRKARKGDVVLAQVGKGKMVLRRYDITRAAGGHVVILSADKEGFEDIEAAADRVKVWGVAVEKRTFFCKEATG